MDAGKKISTSHLSDPTHHLTDLPGKNKNTRPGLNGTATTKTKFPGSSETQISELLSISLSYPFQMKVGDQEAYGHRLSAPGRLRILSWFRHVILNRTLPSRLCVMGHSN
jgi:hypothetical protein